MILILIKTIINLVIFSRCVHCKKSKVALLSGENQFET